MKRKVDMDVKGDLLLLLVSNAHANFGIVAAPEKLAGFAEGDVVRFREPYQRRDGGENGDFVFVTPGNCEKVVDPQVAESCRSFIWGI